MILDDVRNEHYGRAIELLVKPGSVVLDLGAGLGIHALLAARAGADRVYAVEPQPVINAAATAARANHLDRTITFFPERIEDVQLPEPVDLIVSVFTGNLLFTEDLLPSLFHARDRYLKPGGHLLPDRAELWLAPIQTPELHSKHIARWSKPVVGLDYSSARAFAANEIWWPPREEFRAATRLGLGSAVVELDLASSSNADCQGSGQCRATASGVCHALLGWIRIRLLDQWLTTDPMAPPVHWQPAMLPIDPPLPITEGELVQYSVSRPAFGDWTWSVDAQAGSRRHSTFMADAQTGAELRRLAPGSNPGLDKDGELALHVLAALKRGLTNRAIADGLVAAFPIDPASAMRRVQALVSRYGGRR
jgi:hypothetical protein